MRIPSPDAALTALADALLALPQRRGVPYPAALAPFLWLPGLGCACVALSATLTGARDARAVTAWLVGSLFYLLAGGFAQRILAADARAWTPAAAGRYRAFVTLYRLRFAPGRAALLAVCLVQVLLAAMLTVGDAPFPAVAIQWAYAALATGCVAACYAACAMPRDPDLRAPVPSMA